MTPDRMTPPTGVKRAEGLADVLREIYALDRKNGHIMTTIAERPMVSHDQLFWTRQGLPDFLPVAQAALQALCEAGGWDWMVESMWVRVEGIPDPFVRYRARVCVPQGEMRYRSYLSNWTDNIRQPVLALALAVRDALRAQVAP